MGKRSHLCPGLAERTKRSLPRCLFSIFLLLFLLLCNVCGVYYLRIPFQTKIDREPERRPISSLPWSPILYAVREEEIPLSKLAARGTTPLSLPLERSELSGDDGDAVDEERSPRAEEEKLASPDTLNAVVVTSSAPRRTKLGSRKAAARVFTLSSILEQKLIARAFSARVKGFFSRPSCKIRFFLTWISSEELFGQRELLAMESIFKSHPDACVLIVSNSMDTARGNKLLRRRPFLLSSGFRVAAVSPNYRFIFKDTPAEEWFHRLKGGLINPGDVPLGQNLSNLLRLALLYKFGGIYVDTDVIVLKSFSGLRNVIGAQTVDAGTGNWSRLNNAVMIFDKKHPLLYKFIEEFALTFNGNRWGYNGPYLVSRVVSREEPAGLNFSVLKPPAFYPVTWSTIQGLFHGPRSEAHTRWAEGKLNQIRKESFAIHLWNRQSRALRVEEGSVIGRLMLENCVSFNSPQQSAS
ncbi:hypothetical protein H6P81_016850 [Aristolochia fimbriata]|uniref:Alpha 1,4-glycosyltransferase domain-containing protein n=1 Tax=Aristolochia fimbriata TaxID=158543 RepID=A0AAV7DZG8_ARIFI|nr:hypothetical protein H6P81_016850 [Aristolochia fimbriata]